MSHHPESTAGVPDRRARWLALGSGAVLVAVVVAVPLVDDGADAPAAPTTDVSVPAGEDQREARARASLADLSDAWRRGDREAFLRVAAGTPAATRWAAATWRALSDLHVDRLDLRYLGPGVPPTGAPADSAAVAEVSWRQGGWHDPVSSQLVVDLADDGGVLGTRAAPGAATPLWGLAPLRVRDNGPTTMVLLPGAGGRADRVAGLVTTAADQVTSLLPRGWTSGEAGGLLVAVPATTRQFAAVLGAGAVGYDRIAAVTTTVDGTANGSAPAQVVLNPVVFTRLGPVGSQVVLTHEATHVATGAAASGAPLWVVEGFADLVALHGADVPLRVAAGQSLSAVRRSGPPRHLPGHREFGTGTHGLGGSYEQAWLAMRMLERRYGTGPTIRFAVDVTDGRPLGAALRDQLGTDLGSVTAAWRAELTRLARVVG